MDTYPQTVTHAIGRWLECGKNVIVGSGQVFVVLGACVSTSRKHGKKELQSFSRCGSFDHHALQSLKQCRFVFLGLPIDTLGILGLIIYRCKGIEYTFATIYHTPPKNKICSRKLEIKILQLFSDCRSGWSKEPQWENNCGSFLPCFLLVEGVDFNEWLPLHCKLCMCTNDVQFDNSKIFCHAHVNIAFVLTSKCLHLDTLQFLKNSLHICSQKYEIFYIL